MRNTDKDARDKVMDIEILYFEGCPSWQTAQAHLRQALDRLGLDAEIGLVRVETPEEAVEARFVGSPTIRVRGRDLFPADHEDYALGCRVYATPEGLRGWPTVEMIEEALGRERERL